MDVSGYEEKYGSTGLSDYISSFSSSRPNSNRMSRKRRFSQVDFEQAPVMSGSRGSQPQRFIGPIDTRISGMPPYRNAKKASKSFRTGKHGLKIQKRSVPSLYSALRNRAPRSSRGWYNKPGELKYTDLSAAAYVCDTTGSVTALNLLAVGDDATTRDGRQVTLKSCQVQGIVGPLTDTVISPTFVRIMLVWDSQPNSGVIATIANILTASTSVANLNLDNRERFTILRDYKTTIGGMNDASGVSYTMSPMHDKIDWFVPLKGLTTTYSGTTAVIGSISHGALLLVTIGNQAAGSAPSANLTTRVRYYDN